MPPRLLKKKEEAFSYWSEAINSSTDCSRCWPSQGRKNEKTKNRAASPPWLLAFPTFRMCRGLCNRVGSAMMAIKYVCCAGVRGLRFQGVGWRAKKHVCCCRMFCAAVLFTCWQCPPTRGQPSTKLTFKAVGKLAALQCCKRTLGQFRS